MEARIYIKERKGKQMVFVATYSYIHFGKRIFGGYESRKNEDWEDWDMAETVINRQMKEGKLVRIQ